VHRRGHADGGARVVSEAHAGHLATRRSAGLFDFSFMGLYEFSDAAALQALQSRNLARLAPGRIAYTLLLNDDGCVFNDATVWRMDDGRWWLFSGRRGDAGWVAARAAPRVRSGEHAVLALQGPASGAILARLLGEERVRALRYFGFAPYGAAGTGYVGRIGYSGELGYEIVVPARDESATRTALLEAGKGLGLRECSFEAANSLRIESGYLLFDREITGRETPAQLGLARLVERPRPRTAAAARRLVGLEIGAQPVGPRPWLPAASATSECESPVFGRVLGLGFVEADAASPGTPVQLQDGRLARVARLPFYDPTRTRPRATPL
jgi:glycine cleavage system aminomethyltransferase T